VALGRDGDFRTIDMDGDQPMAAVSGFRDDERVVAFYEGQAYEFELAARGSVHGHHATADGVIEAPMPGRVTAVEVKAGQQVAKGDRLVTLEAMKMEHALTAPFDGVVAELNATAGEQVVEGTILVRIDDSRETA
jgi:3-methylcrotonyl-CoA carboxylase alpha subunit